MAPAWVRNLASLSLTLAAAVLLAGCPVPLPYGYSESSRENLTEESAYQLVPGVTTREDVLLLLGEPDGVGPDESWFAYGSVYGKGGVVFVICAASDCGGAGTEKVEYGRLLVTFDDRGLITNTDFVSKDCWEGLLFIIGPSAAGNRSSPCLQVNTPGSSAQMVMASADIGNDNSGEPILIPEDLYEFAKGNAELATPGWTTGLSEAWAAGSNKLLTKELHDSGQWESLARVVLNDNYGDDLRWYYLGWAAEGIGLCDAARHYYDISMERNKSFVTRCPGVANPVILLPEALLERLTSIEEKRNAGRCVDVQNIQIRK